MLPWVLFAVVSARFEDMSREALVGLRAAIDEELSARGSSVPVVSRFQYPHKQTFASSDPAAAARFVRDHLGGGVIITNTSHTCDDGSVSGFTHIVTFRPTANAPKGFEVHFVRNPHKPPGAGVVPGTGVNATTLGDRVEVWRAGFERGFDQFVDTHLGLAFDSLDPLVDHWDRHGIPYICRTWCCDADDCPQNRTNTQWCEQGCYVEVPHGVIVEALCGLGGGQPAARQCLTKATAIVFDLCSGS